MTQMKSALVIGGDAQDAIAALIGFEQRIAKAEAAAKRLKAANDDMATGAVRASGQAQAGYVNLGRQASDVAVMMQGGANIGMIVATQSAQIVDALQMVAAAQGNAGGKMAKFAAFMGGPWGIALTVAGSLALTFASSLFDVADASDAAKDAADDLAKRQLDIKNFFDVGTGAIREQNAELVQNAILLRQDDIRKRAAEGEKRKSRVIEIAEESRSERPVVGYRQAASVGAAVSIPIYGAGNNDIAKALSLPAAQRAEELRKIATSKSSNAKRAGELSGIYAEAALARREQRRDSDEIRSLETGTLASSLRTPAKTKTRKTRGGNNAAERAKEFAEDTAAKIAGIRDEFADLPSAIEKSNKALRQLDDIASDIEGKKGPNYDKMRADIGEARAAINASLNQPFEAYLEKAREGAALDKLLIAGKDDQAEALKIVLDLEQKMKPLTAEQLETVQATVVAERRRAAVLRDQREIIAAQVNAVRDMRGALQQTVANAMRGRFSVKGILSSIGNSYIDIVSKKTVEALFGPTLRELEEEASGQGPLKKAAVDMAGDLGRTGEAAKDLATAFRESIATIRGEAVGAQIEAAPAPAASLPPAEENPDIVVNGYPAKPGAAPDGKTGHLIIGMVDQLARQIGIKLPPAFVASAKELLGELETDLPKVLGTAVMGAGVGQMVFGNSKGAGIGGAIGGVVGKELGKMAGKAIGGALGKMAGPIGSIAGSLLGGALGSMLAKTKTGTASVGNVAGQAKVAGTSGNSASRVSAARGLASTALSALDQIVEQLNGQLGSFSGSIGIRNDKFVVDPTGAGRTKGAGVQKFASEAEAQQALLADLLADGAVKGVSAAVAKALGGSGDVEKRLKEALKVQELELAIGGIGAAMDKEFRTFERQAAERLRIAREYGFDIVKIEEQNAKDRLKLSEKLLADQVGSLQDLIDELTSGGLFEGSAVDRRQLLLGQIAATKAEADAGTEGAADKLAQLLEQLNSVSKEAFATTGNFAADRATILDAARDSIAKANARINEAQKASDPALAQTNAALDENNDQNARIIDQLQSSNAILSGLYDLNAGSGGSSLSDLARTGVIIK